eukprot:COSAG02_NODE_1820_length_10770_cov_89.157905_3_plen_110_part_00
MCFKRCASNEVGRFAFEYAEPSWGAGGGWAAWTHLGAPRASSKGRFGVSFGSNFFGQFFFHGGDLGTVIVIRPQAGAVPAAAAAPAAPRTCIHRGRRRDHAGTVTRRLS